MTEDLIFYTNPMSRGRIVRWMLEEVGTPYRTELLEYGPAGMKGDAYRALNPMGKVPSIVHRGQVVTEGAAICAYLADAFPEAGLAPPLAERAAYYRWLFVASGPLNEAIVDTALGRTIPADKKPLVGYSDFETVLDMIAQTLTGREFIASDRFSAADCYVGAVLSFFIGFGLVPPRPLFTNYVARLENRPAFVRSVEIDGEMPSPDRT